MQIMFTKCGNQQQFPSQGNIEKVISYGKTKTINVVPGCNNLTCKNILSVIKGRRKTLHSIFIQFSCKKSTLTFIGDMS